MLCAVIQMTSTERRPANLEQAAALLASAKAQGAQLAVLPEHFSYLAAMEKMPAKAEPLQGPTVKFLSQQAREHGLWIIGGSFARKSADPSRAYNTCPVLAPSGELVAFYDKVHMFDLALPGQAAWEESRYVKNGRRLVTVETPAGLVGLSICYDLRFPELYRRLRPPGGHGALRAGRLHPCHGQGALGDSGQGPGGGELVLCIGRGPGGRTRRAAALLGPGHDRGPLGRGAGLP